jgi:hypothetical protein
VVLKGWEVFDMKMKLSMVGVVIGTLLLAATPASAGSPVVMGLQTLNATGDSCTDASADLTMAGGLVGCWYIDSFVLTGETPSGSAMLSGTEHFTGCIDADSSGGCGGGDPTGTFFTTFTFTAKFDPNGNEIHGRCNHPIVDGDGGFDGATGVLNFTDDVTTVPVSATYVGVVRL